MGEAAADSRSYSVQSHQSVLRRVHNAAPAMRTQQRAGRRDRCRSDDCIPFETSATSPIGGLSPFCDEICVTAAPRLFCEQPEVAATPRHRSLHAAGRAGRCGPVPRVSGPTDDSESENRASAASPLERPRPGLDRLLQRLSLCMPGQGYRHRLTCLRIHLGTHLSIDHAFSAIIAQQGR